MILKKIKKLSPGITLQNQHNSAPFLTGPLHLYVTFYMQIPTSLSLKKKQNLNKSPHLIKPDLDNLIKFVNDVCNDILFADDAIVASITARKVYDSKPRTEFYFEEAR